MKTKTLFISVICGLLPLFECSDSEVQDNNIGSQIAQINGADAACGTSCPASAMGVYSVCSGSGVIGQGTSSCPWTNWETSLNAQPGATTLNGSSWPYGAIEIYFPAGVYAQQSTIQMKPGWTVRGAGMRASTIITTPSFPTNADAFALTFPPNTANAGHVTIEDVSIQYATAGAPGGAAIDIMAADYVHIHRVYTQGFQNGIVFDQAQLSDIDESDVESPTVAGLWIVGTNDHRMGSDCASCPSATYCACVTQQTNRITVRKNQFNLSTAGSVAIADEGGAVHTIADNNFNGGSIHIRMAGSSQVRVIGNEMESATSHNIYLTNTTLANTTLGTNGFVTLQNNFVSASSGHACVYIVNASGPFAFNYNNFSGCSASGCVQGTQNVYQVHGLGNYSPTMPIFDHDSTVGLYALQTSTTFGVGVGTSNPTQALEVKGGARLNTTASAPTCDSSSRGTFWVVQGGSGTKDSVQVCAKDASNIYAWRTLY